MVGEAGGGARAALRMSPMVQEEAAVVEEARGASQGLQEAAVTMQTPPLRIVGEWLLCCGGRAGTQCAQPQAQVVGALAAS
uniref:Uncharacterized protein n=1 Tax=Arundo donax TaxID=35708 RepID=A0A0A9BG52_ARUDO